MLTKGAVREALNEAASHGVLTPLGFLLYIKSSGKGDADKPFVFKLDVIVPSSEDEDGGLRTYLEGRAQMVLLAAGIDDRATEVSVRTFLTVEEFRRVQVPAQYQFVGAGIPSDVDEHIGQVFKPKEVTAEEAAKRAEARAAAKAAEAAGSDPVRVMGQR